MVVNFQNLKNKIQINFKIQCSNPKSQTCPPVGGIGLKIQSSNSKRLSLLKNWKIENWNLFVI